MDVGKGVLISLGLILACRNGHAEAAHVLLMDGKADCDVALGVMSQAQQGGTHVDRACLDLLTVGAPTSQAVGHYRRRGAGCG